MGKLFTDKMIVENANPDEILSALQKYAEINADIYISLSKIIQNNRGKKHMKLIRQLIKENQEG
jgi:hypothetical protein